MAGKHELSGLCLAVMSTIQINARLKINVHVLITPRNAAPFEVAISRRRVHSGFPLGAHTAQVRASEVFELTSGDDTIHVRQTWHKVKHLCHRLIY